MSEPTAEARSRLYHLLAAAFGFPDEALYGTLADGSWLEVVEEALGALPYDFVSDEALAALRLAADETYETFQADFIQQFELGAAGPPCPLYEGIYSGGRTQVWEELIRFYNHFGLHLSKENRDLPDHIATELEFLHYLSWREATSDDGESVAALRRAERDFVSRHPVAWLSQLATRLEKKQAPAFYRALVGLTQGFAIAEARYLAAVAEGETGQSALVGPPFD